MEIIDIVENYIKKEYELIDNKLVKSNSSDDISISILITELVQVFSLDPWFVVNLVDDYYKKNNLIYNYTNAKNGKSFVVIEYHNVEYVIINCTPDIKIEIEHRPLNPLSYKTYVSSKEKINISLTLNDNEVNDVLHTQLISSIFEKGARDFKITVFSKDKIIFNECMLISISNNEFIGQDDSHTYNFEPLSYLMV